MGLRFIYLDNPCGEMNPTRLVGGRMMAEIIAGGQKSELAFWSFSGIAGDDGDRGQAAWLRRCTGRLRRSVARADDGGGSSYRGGPPSAEGDSREREREREREKCEQATWPILNGVVQFFKNCT
ncbi:hypothetical protein PanWU01x14_033190 [Parasponia andersonii]|uniref:Uncharacterized protein n=1 Tax=Parasponia andersonii TaxID=3476 RepID=A0A2P5DTL2_PARAD|nr:hypothetical protein PanWU01x14_033190 [Parasponia andersonii]